MPDAIRVGSSVVVPAAAIEVRTARSSGPGGQNVNKVASKVDLRVDLARVLGLTAAARRRLEALAAGRRDASGRLVVTSQRTRDQGRNLEDAKDKVRRLVLRSLIAPRPRLPTRATAASRERRLLAKRRAGERKRTRGPVAGED